MVSTVYASDKLDIPKNKASIAMKGLEKEKSQIFNSKSSKLGFTPGQTGDKYLNLDWKFLKETK